MTVLVVLTGLMNGEMLVKEMIVNDLSREQANQETQEEEQGQDSQQHKTGEVRMTRCIEFYRAVRKNGLNCKDTVCDNVRSHMRYMDRQFPKWLENDELDMSSFAERNTRPLRRLERHEPEKHAEVLELVCEGLAPKEAIRQVETRHVKPVNIPKNCVNDSIENILEYLEPDSVDLILTDPPYPAEYLPLWSVLAEKAEQLLKPGGFLVTYSGQIYLPEIFEMFKDNLSYVWTFALIMGAPDARVWVRNIWQGWKPILVFAKPPYEMEWQTDVLTSPARVKTEHEWQQNIEPVKTLIKKFTLEKQLVVDPFLGSGTTMRACEELNRQFFGMDTDEGVFRNG